MSKNLLQDMVKIKRPVVSGIEKNRQERRMPEEKIETKEDEEAQILYSGFRHGKNNSRYKLWFVAAVSLIFFLFGISSLFSKVTVTVNPKIKEVILNESLSAEKGAVGEKLSFDLVIISGEEEKMVEGAQEKDILQKAEGSVVIYNNFNQATQRLDVDTRLEGSNGKIYKTKNQVIVPGIKGGTPGSVSVDIYAAEGGEEYNSGPLDFTIFGFKGTPKYSKFYARSKGEIVGGFKGKAFSISDAERISITNDLKIALQAKLFKRATEQIPSGFVLFKGGALFDMNNISLPPTSSKNNLLSVKVEGTLYGFLFNEEKLSKKIAENNVDGYDGSSIFIPDMRNLNFSLPDKDSLSLANIQSVNFHLSGPAKIVWKLDEDKLKADLLEKSKKDFNQILSQYPNIDSAYLKISPPWRRSISDESKDIKIIVNY